MQPEPKPDMPFAPQPAFDGADALDDEIAPEQVCHWKIMGAIVFALLLVVAYLYQSRIGSSLEQMSADVTDAQVVTLPATPDAVTATPDEVPPSSVSTPEWQ